MENVISRKKPTLTVKDIAKMIGLKPDGVYSLMNSGLIPHYRFGRTIRFDETEIRDWMEKSHNPENPEKG